MFPSIYIRIIGITNVKYLNDSIGHRISAHNHISAHAEMAKSLLEIQFIIHSLHAMIYASSDYGEVERWVSTIRAIQFNWLVELKISYYLFIGDRKLFNCTKIAGNVSCENLCITEWIVSNFRIVLELSPGKLSCRHWIRSIIWIPTYSVQFNKIQWNAVHFNCGHVQQRRTHQSATTHTIGLKSHFKEIFIRIAWRLWCVNGNMFSTFPSVRVAWV